MEHAPPPPPPGLPPSFDPASTGVSDDEKLKALIGHLVPLLNYATGLLGLVALIVMYVIMREQSRWLGNQLRQSMYLMILSVGIAVCVIIISLVTCGIGAFIAIPLIVVWAIAEIVLRIIAAVKSHAGEDYVYPIVGSWTFLP